MFGQLEGCYEFIIECVTHCCHQATATLCDKSSVSVLNETVRVVFGGISGDEIGILILCITFFLYVYTSNYDCSFNYAFNFK